MFLPLLLRILLYFPMKIANVYVAKSQQIYYIEVSLKSSLTIKILEINDVLKRRRKSSIQKSAKFNLKESPIPLFLIVN
jgi:hypothetical protein